MVPDPDFTPQTGLLRDLLESEKRLRQAIEAEAQTARQALESLARELVPELADQLTKQSPIGLAGLSPDQLAAQISQRLRSRLARPGTPAPAPPPAPEIQQLQLALAQKEQALQNAQGEIRRLSAQIARLESAPPPVPAPIPHINNEESPLSEGETGPEEVLFKAGDFQPAAPPEFWPGWFEEWVKSRGFGNDLLIVKALGETGEPVRVRLMRRLAQQLHFADVPGSLGRAVQRLHKMGLVKIIPVLKPTRQGHVRQAHMLHLTDQEMNKGGLNGQDAYRLLFGQEAVRQDAVELLSRHKAPEHAYLILETQALLEKAGFTVERFPDPVEVGELGRYEPDLVARYDGQTLSIEVERATLKNESQRDRKFRRYWEISQGRFWIVTDTAAAADTLTSEIAYQAGNLGKRIRLRLLIVEAVVPDAVPQGWDIWPPEQVF